MGAGMPGGLDQAKQDEMKRCVEEICVLFAKNFPLAFAIEIALAAKAELTPNKNWKDELQLLDPAKDKAAPQDKDLMEGKVTKRGGKVTNWKERHMVLHGESQNYLLEYFTEKGGKEKGKIELSGYVVRQVPEEGLTLTKSAIFEQVFMRAQMKEGQYALKLDPWAYGRRKYYFIFDTIEEGKKWKKALEDGCWYARNPCDENPVVAAAFNRCMQMVRDQYSRWIWISYYGDEASRLGQFMAAAIYDAVLRDTINDLPDAGRETAESMIVSVMQGMISGAAKGTYSAAREAACKLQPTLMEKIKPLIQPYVTQEEKIKAQVAEKVGSTIGPVIQPLTDKFLAPMAAILTKKTVEGCSKMITGFSKYIDDKHSEPNWMDEMISYSQSWYWSPADGAFNVAWDAWSYYADRPAELVPGCTSSQVYSILLGRFKTLAKRAAFTFKAKYEGNVARKSEFLAELKHDCIVMMHATLIDIFMDALGDTICNGIKKPGMKLLDPVQEAIDSVPVPGLSEFLNLENMLDDVLSGSMTAIFENILEKEVETGKEQLKDIPI